MEPGQAIKAWRQQRGYSQERLAEASELPRGTIARLERNAGSPKHGTLLKIANGLRLLSVAQLLEGPPEGSEQPPGVADSPATYFANHPEKERRAQGLVPLPLFQELSRIAPLADDSPGRRGTYHVLRHIAHADFVVLRISGDRMRPTLLDGDLALVNRHPPRPRSQQIIVCEYKGDPMVVRLRREGSHLILWPDNPNYAPVEVTEPEQFRIHGLVTRVIDRDLAAKVL
jgi:SOS-response transcriptional repressor LexA